MSNFKIFLILFFEIIHIGAQTIGVFMTIRHGARAPREVTARFQQIGITYPLQLTELGKKEQKILGEKIKNKHNNFDFSNSIFLSSPKSRCIDSMEYFKIGLMGQKAVKTIILPKKFVNAWALMHFDQNKIEFANSRLKEDILNLKNNAFEQNYQLIRNVYCQFCLEPANEFETLREMKLLAGTVECYRRHQIEDQPVSQNLMNYMNSAFRLLYYALIFKTKNEAKTYTNENLKIMGKSILETFLKATGNRELEEQFRHLFKSEYNVSNSMFVFAHDGNLMSLLRLIVSKKELLEKPIFRPPFSAHLKFELFHRKPEQKMHVFDLGKNKICFPLKKENFEVRIKYMNKVLRPKFCQYRNCSLEQFLNLIKSNII